jgi:hypothetical protein
MPVRVRAKPPGEFIRDHLVDVGGVDYPQSIHRAYKAYLRVSGLKNTSSRATMSKYIWLARKLGLIVFDHAEAPAYWDAVAEGVQVSSSYQPESRPQAPSPRHYYRLVDATDPRWIRLEASYRQSIGIEVPPPFPRVPYIPPAEPEEEVAPARRRRAPKPAKPKKPKAAKVKKPTPAATAQAAAAPYEARILQAAQALDELEKNPTPALIEGLEEELLSIGEDAVEEAVGKRGLVRERLIGIGTLMRRALADYPLVKAAYRRLAQETLPARQATAEMAYQAALRVMRETLVGREG